MCQKNIKYLQGVIRTAMSELSIDWFELAVKVFEKNKQISLR
jgi:hypothetical protein